MLNQLQKKIRKGKASYRRKIEEQLLLEKVSVMWKSLKTISGYKAPHTQSEGGTKVGQWPKPLFLGLLKHPLLPPPSPLNCTPSLWHLDSPPQLLYFTPLLPPFHQLSPKQSHPLPQNSAPLPRPIFYSSPGEKRAEEVKGKAQTKDTRAVEDLLCGAGAQNNTDINPLSFQTSCSIVPSDDGTGETGPRTFLSVAGPPMGWLTAIR